MNKIILESHNLKNRTTGFGVFNYELIKAFSQLDFNDNIHLVAKDINELKNEFGKKFDYIKYYDFMKFNLFSIKRNNIDVWHSLNQNISVEPYLKPKKYVLTIHDVNFAEEDTNDFSIKKKNLFYKKLQRTDYITFISKYAKEQTEKYFDISGIENKIIYNGNSISQRLDLKDFKPRIQIDSPYFFTISAFIEKKNFESIIRLMPFFPDYKLVIAGNNSNEYGQKIKNLIIEMKLESRVILTNKISEIEKQYYMQNCDAFLFPSVGEGFGLPPIEAMSFGKPILLSNKTSLPEIGGDDAFYWDNFDSAYMADVLAKALEKYNNNKDYYIEKYIQRSKEFDWNKAAKEYLDIYKI
ncbi:glycosyltransferase family 1 protein [Chishuiella sp.]|uniref:glycosyltransferase family 4 protein n=1 Tax=Chishuiella sp. TaxID=1969467 RepID=UPI0028B03C48|nr:glycosyltransferase family 1 protein [Chishuiella sp.]